MLQCVTYLKVDLQSQGYESWNDAGRFFDPIKYCVTDCWMLYALTLQLQLHNNAYINYFHIDYSVCKM